MLNSLLFALILLPIIAGLVVAALPWRSLRIGVIFVTAAMLCAAAVKLVSGGTFAASVPDPSLVSWNLIIAGLDFALLGWIFLIGVKRRSWIVMGLAVLQLGPLAWFEATATGHEKTAPLFYGDSLALVMVLVVSLIGSLICVFAIPYMREHEAHLKLARSREPRFFAILLIFLGAMNGLVLANDLLWLYFFFEVTTLCSFLLIGHDGTEEAQQNATKALWMNSVGGVAFVGAILLAYSKTHTLDLQAVLAQRDPSSIALLLSAALLCLAGFTKAAQVPFQGWLLGAMVAPTPVSALLHSSTMVKAGVYLVLRMAPLFAGTAVAQVVSHFGGFVFLAAALLAISQSNGKRVLAYSTVSNLGLIIACAGIGTATAVTAAVFLVIFHAVSKALLFMSVGTVEQVIGSRDIEDMRGLYLRMRSTTVIMVVGILTMLLPPFGVLLGKWLTIEAAASSPLLLVFVALGSAASVVFWARWAGALVAAPRIGASTKEKQSPMIRVPLVVLAATAVALPLAVPVVSDNFIKPMLGLAGSTVPLGAYHLYLVYGGVAATLAVGALAVRSMSSWRVTSPYMSGAGADPDGATFDGPMGQRVRLQTANYYLVSVFGEHRLGRWASFAGAALLVLLLVGGVL